MSAFVNFLRLLGKTLFSLFPHVPFEWPQEAISLVIGLITRLALLGGVIMVIGPVVWMVVLRAGQPAWAEHPRRKCQWRLPDRNHPRPANARAVASDTFFDKRGALPGRTRKRTK